MHDVLHSVRAPDRQVLHIRQKSLLGGLDQFYCLGGFLCVFFFFCCCFPTRIYTEKQGIFEDLRDEYEDLNESAII